MNTTKNKFEPHGTIKAQINWDKLYSTYYWKIYLDKNNPKNSYNVEFLQGYSKVEHQREAQDLVYLLKSKIINLYKNGYFNRIERIEIYQRLDNIINTKNDIKILILEPTQYDINPNYLDTVFKNYGLFLEDFYSRIKNSLPMDGLITPKRKPISDDDRLNVNIVKLKDLSALYSYAARLLIHGHPQGAVNSFIHKYKELKKW